mmetsp:Transcript_19320/g.65664  ORF Transcript_19320/g.65664 Transcript_19320/m.65664 type:complete len:119 (+) Transcript_19320:215-571(+)
MAHFRPGFNIDRLVLENEKYAAAAEYDNSLKTVARNCEWHEKQFQASGGSVLKGDLSDPPAVTSDLEIKSEVQLELQMASKAVALQRKAKLRQVLGDEQLMYEAELNTLGLSIEKTRH